MWINSPGTGSELVLSPVGACGQVVETGWAYPQARFCPQRYPHLSRNLSTVYPQAGLYIERKINPLKQNSAFSGAFRVQRFLSTSIIAFLQDVYSCFRADTELTDPGLPSSGSVMQSTAVGDGIRFPGQKRRSRRRTLCAASRDPLPS